MKLYFYTKDTQLDYPNIGWIPSLDGVNPDIVKILSGLHRFHAGDYPELILFRKEKSWVLYLSAFNSGRTDYVGRTIQVTLVISASANETFAEKVYSLIEQYVDQLATGTTSITFLQDFFIQHIQPGQPEQWSGKGTSGKKAVSQELLDALLYRLPASSSTHEKKANQCWFGGAKTCSQEFLTVCRNLIFNPNRIDGAAMVLPNIGPVSLSNPQLMFDTLNPLGVSENAVFLLADQSDSRIQHTEFVPRNSKTETNLESEEMMYKKLFYGTALLAAVLMISLIISWRSISSLSQDLSTLKQGVSTLKQGVSALTQDLSALTQDLSALKQDVSTLKQDVSTLKQDVSTLKTENQNLKKSLLETQKQVQSLQKQLPVQKQIDTPPVKQ